MLIPNHNWQSITAYVATMPIFRAIEHGFSMMRVIIMDYPMQSISTEMCWQKWMISRQMKEL
jgi:hypothetical protein